MRVGVDIVQIARIASALRKSQGFVSLVYTTNEIQIAQSFGEVRREQFFAGRFAIKEAVAKALHLGIGDGSVLRQIEALPAEDGSPRVALHGQVLELATQHGLRNCEVSLSHDAGLVIAFAMLN
jgi:holo-[acyl-carrier protein] synthase